MSSAEGGTCERVGGDTTYLVLAIAVTEARSVAKTLEVKNTLKRQLVRNERLAAKDELVAGENKVS